MLEIGGARLADADSLALGDASFAFAIGLSGFTGQHPLPYLPTSPRELASTWAGRARESWTGVLLGSSSTGRGSLLC